MYAPPKALETPQRLKVKIDHMQGDAYSTFRTPSRDEAAGGGVITPQSSSRAPQWRICYLKEERTSHGDHEKKNEVPASMATNPVS